VVEPPGALPLAALHRAARRQPQRVVHERDDVGEAEEGARHDVGDAGEGGGGAAAQLGWVGMGMGMGRGEGVGGGSK
jgi:hypothetical protein